MQLHDLAFWIENQRHARDFLFQIIEICLGLSVVIGDDSGAAAKPAQRFAKRNVKIEGKSATGFVAYGNFFKKPGPGERIVEFGRRRVTGIARPGNIILLHQVKVYVQRAHNDSQRYRMLNAAGGRAGFCLPLEEAMADR